MITISYSSAFWDDMVRLTEFLLTQNMPADLATYDIVMHGIDLLKKHPEIGRLATSDGLRELVISRSKTGYIALYNYDELLDLVNVVSIWHQRKEGLD